MKQIVVDASVAVKWVVTEQFSANAEALLTSCETFFAPAHCLAEAANTIWAQSAIRKLMSREEAIERIMWLSEHVCTNTAELGSLIKLAADYAFDLHLTIYDTLYLSLASEISVPFVTADLKLYNAAKADARLADLVVWLGDVPCAS